jgi:hypothetical protein
MDGFLIEIENKMAAYSQYYSKHFKIENKIFKKIIFENSTRKIFFLQKISFPGEITATSAFLR